MKSKKTYTAPDGVTWKVIVQAPGSSNAMILFRHPDGQSSRLDPEKILEGLDAGTIMRLFQRSMSVSRKDPLQAPEPPRGD